MEMLRKTPRTIALSSMKMMIRTTMWMLDFICTCVGGIGTNVPNLREEKLNFSLAFPNGETQEIEVSKNNYDSYESKRMKLVLDISVLPNDNYKVVSAENLPRSHFQVNFIQRFFDMFTYYILRTVRIGQLILEEMEHLVDNEDKSIMRNTNGSYEDRKRKSPRKRLPESNRRPYRQFLTRLWEILGFVQPNNILFEPISANCETSFNTSLNGTNSKHEKRKLPETSGSELSDNDEDTLPLQNGAVESPRRESASEIYEAPEDSSKEGLNTSNLSEEVSPSNEVKQNYFEVEEDYASADDPDYAPTSPSHSSSASSVSDNSEHLLEEINDLKKDIEQTNEPNQLV